MAGEGESGRPLRSHLPKGSELASWQTPAGRAFWAEGMACAKAHCRSSFPRQGQITWGLVAVEELGSKFPSDLSFDPE